MGWMTETLLDDAAPGSRIGLFACPPRKYLKTWKILWSHPALTGKQGGMSRRTLRDEWLYGLGVG